MCENISSFVVTSNYPHRPALFVTIRRDYTSLNTSQDFFNTACNMTKEGRFIYVILFSQFRQDELAYDGKESKENLNLRLSKGTLPHHTPAAIRSMLGADIFNAFLNEHTVGQLLGESIHYLKLFYSVSRKSVNMNNAHCSHT